MKIVKDRPSKKCLKCLTARDMASNSLSNADHFCCAEEKFLEKKAIGRVTPSTVCWMTAPIAESDASVISCVGALRTGKASTVPYASFCFMAQKASLASSFHSIGLRLTLLVESKA